MADPLDDIRALIAELPQPDERAARALRHSLTELTEGGDGLGRLEELAIRVARATGKAPVMRRPTLALFVGSHGSVANLPQHSDGGRSARLVSLCSEGRAAVNHACVAGDVGLKVFDLALDVPVGDITSEAAFEERDCVATIAFGMEAVAGGVDLVCLAGAGDGAALASAAMLAAIEGQGAAVDDADFSAAVDAAIAAQGEGSADPLLALTRLGGREFAACFGAIVAGRVEKVPVILDGSVAVTAASLLAALRPDAVSHCFLAQLPLAVPARRAAERLNLPVLLDFAVAREDGTGGALAAGLLKGVARVVEGALAPSR